MSKVLDSALRDWEVYELVDPRTLEPKYVGITHMGVKKRKCAHLQQARAGGKSHRDNWIRSLMRAGLQPIVNVLQRGNGPGWQDCERSFIASHRVKFNMTNATDGGEGSVGAVRTEAQKAHLSRLNKGKKLSAKHRAKLSASMKGVRRSDKARANMSAAFSTPEHRAAQSAVSPLKHRIVCVETGEVYASIGIGAKAIGRHKTSLSKSIKDGTRCAGYHHKRNADQNADKD